MFRSKPTSTVPAKTPMTDGRDWLNGTPSRRGSLVHDAWADLDGNLWFTSNVPNHDITIGRIDAKTGEVKMLQGARRRTGSPPTRTA